MVELGEHLSQLSLHTLAHQFPRWLPRLYTLSTADVTNREYTADVTNRKYTADVINRKYTADVTNRIEAEPKTIIARAQKGTCHTGYTGYEPNATGNCITTVKIVNNWECILAT